VVNSSPEEVSVQDYGEWCDDITLKLADYAEAQYGNFVNLNQFAQEYLHEIGYPSPTEDSARWRVISAIQDVSQAFGLPFDGQSVHYGILDLDTLRKSYARWEACMQLPIELDQDDLSLIDTLNQLSQQEKQGTWSVEEIGIGDLLAAAGLKYRGASLSIERALALLKPLTGYKLVKAHLTMGYSGFKATYVGVTRRSRTQVIDDAEIDDLRLAGEGDTLDYKRRLVLNSPTQKLDFAKDVCAFANAGGHGSRYLLVGVDDNGTFPSDATNPSHIESLNQLRETTLQQITTERTLHTPSVKIKGRGVHRDGPYVLIEISRNPAYLPYRTYANPTDRHLPSADTLGEVWIRKGSTKHLATLEEIRSLEKQASEYRRVFGGRR
jgi:hypothetical protein